MSEGLDMLSEVLEIAHEAGANAIISTGDLFHVKAPHKTSHALIQQLFGILGTSKIPVYVVPGNHDMSTLGINSMARQPLGVLHQGHVLKVVTSQRAVDLGERVKLVGREYNERRDVDPRWYDIGRQGDDVKHNILVAHGSIIPEREVRPYPTITPTAIFKNNPQTLDVIFSGHIHEDLGIWQPEFRQYFINVGALGRTARTEANMSRTIKVILAELRGDDWTFEEIPLKQARPATDIFHELAPVVETDDEIADFVTGLATGTAFETMELTNLVHDLGLPKDIEARVLGYLEEVGA